jgi:hypothetical protein
VRREFEAHGTPVAIKNCSREASSPLSKFQASISFDHCTLWKGRRKVEMSKEIFRVLMMLMIIMMVAFASAVVSAYAQF